MAMNDGCQGRSILVWSPDGWRMQPVAKSQPSSNPAEGGFLQSPLVYLDWMGDARRHSSGINLSLEMKVNSPTNREGQGDHER
jgi:hypothetical protein